MFQIFLIIHVVICLGLISLVLVQHGKGAEMGASFGGASQTLFGAQGSGNFLTKSTSILAALFFLNCLFLGYLGTHQQIHDPLKNISEAKIKIDQPAESTTQNTIIKE